MPEPIQRLAVPIKIPRLLFRVEVLPAMWAEHQANSDIGVHVMVSGIHKQGWRGRLRGLDR